MLNVRKEILEIIHGKMEYNASAKNRAGINAVRTHPDTNRNIPRGFTLTFTFLHSTYPINTQAE
jgi:hypothetical protein